MEKDTDNIHEELSEDILCEMANLDESDTGIKGIVFVSTKMGTHGPRVKYYTAPPRSHRTPCLIVSISPNPEIKGNYLGNVGQQIAPTVIDWVRLNHVALLQFWNEGHSWTRKQVSSFLDALKRV